MHLDSHTTADAILHRSVLHELLPCVTFLAAYGCVYVEQYMVFGECTF